MWFSPELQRNFWLQLSWGRILAAPILLGILVAALLAAWKLPPNKMAEIARGAFVLLLAFWSTRRVADSLAEEVGGGTWEKPAHVRHVRLVDGVGQADRRRDLPVVLLADLPRRDDLVRAAGVCPATCGGAGAAGGDA